MKIIFKNGAEVTYLNAVETEEYWGGSSRRTLTFTCAPDAVSIDALNAVLSDSANLKSIELHGEFQTQEIRDDGIKDVKIPVTNIYEDYTKKLRVGIEPVLVQPESPDRPVLYEDRLVFKLGRPTFIEQQLAALGITAAAQ